MCELRIAEYLRSKLRTGIRGFSNNSGRTSLEVQNLPTQLTKIPGMRDQNAFCKAYGLSKSEIVPFSSSHKIFFLMDKDAADAKTWNLYKQGKLFEDLWVAPYAVAIFFEPDLDNVSSLAGYPIKKSEHKPDQIQKYLAYPKSNYLRDLAAMKSSTNLALLLDYLKGRGYQI